MIDGVTLTDSISQLFKKGKVAKVKTVVGFVNDEGANTAPRNTSFLDSSTNSIWNLTDSQVKQAVSYYPNNATFGYASPDNFFLTIFKSYIMSLSPFGEQGITGSERLVARYMSKAVGQNKVWSFRFNAPGVGTNYSGLPYPLNYVAHSADNNYLQNATAVMTPFEKSLALEWRAYIGSFIRHGDPNKEKLSTSPTWHSYGALGGGEYVNSPVRLVTQFAYQSNANGSLPTSTQLEVSQKAQLERVDWWLTDAILGATRV
jgi:carboxylesterase type B